MKKWKSKLFAILMAVCMIVGSTGAISTMPVFAATIKRLPYFLEPVSYSMKTVYQKIKNFFQYEKVHIKKCCWLIILPTAL